MDAASTRRVIVPLQPRPLFVLADPQCVGGRWLTPITRGWRPGDVDRCRLCPEGSCGANEYGVCQVTAPGLVPDRLAPLFSLAAALAGSQPRAGRRVDGVGH